MRISCSAFVFAAAFKMVLVLADIRSQKFIPREPHQIGLYHPYQEKIPRHCWAPPRHIDLYKCCEIPNLYSDEVMDRCGIEKESLGDSNAPAKTKSPPKVPCKEGLCLMKNANLLKTNTSVDYEKLRTYIDQWAEANPEFSEAILVAKETCAKEETSGPPLCEPDKIYICLNAIILWECKFKETDDCQVLRLHMDECRPYYMKPKEHEENAI